MKTLPHKLLMLCPYLYGAVLALLFCLDNVLSNADSDTLIFLMIGAFLLLPLLLGILHLAVARPRQEPAVWAKQNLISKVFCTFACLAAAGILVYTVISTNRAAAEGAQEGGLAVFLWILLLLPVFTCGFFQLIAGTLICAKLKEADSTLAWYHIPLHLIPIADLFSAATVYRKFRT